MTSSMSASAEVLPAEQLGRVHLIGIGGIGMSALARLLLSRGIPTSGSELKDWPALAELWLGSNRIGNDGAWRLAAATQFPGLRQLDLRGNAITNTGAQSALKSRFKQALTI